MEAIDFVSRRVPNKSALYFALAYTSVMRHEISFTLQFPRPHISTAETSSCMQESFATCRLVKDHMLVGFDEFMPCESSHLG